MVYAPKEKEIYLGFILIFEEGIVMVYKYYSNLSEYALNNLKNDVLCFNHADEFNDNLEFDINSEFLKDEQIKEQKFRLRVCSFSKHGDLENMWG